MRRLSEKERFVIAVLGHDEMYGLDIVKNSGGMLKRGAIYITLSKMVDDGFLLSRGDGIYIAALGVERRLFRATFEGKLGFSDWVTWRE